MGITPIPPAPRKETINMAVGCTSCGASATPTPDGRCDYCDQPVGDRHNKTTARQKIKPPPTKANITQINGGSSDVPLLPLSKAAPRPTPNVTMLQIVAVVLFLIIVIPIAVELLGTIGGS